MNPQRLLQIQQAANPSLRAAATPASILQGGGVTPQYSVSPQGNNFNPQAQQINYTTPVAAPYQINGPVQVAHPQPLYVGSPAGSVINQGSGQTSLPGFTPGPSVAHSVISGITEPFTVLGKQIGSQFNYLSGPTRTQRGLPGAPSIYNPTAPNIISSQTTAAKNPAYANLINSYKGRSSAQGLLDAESMATQGAAPQVIKQHLDKDAANVDAQNKKALGVAAQIASYGVGAGGIGAKGAIKAITSTAAAGGVGTAGNTLANNPKASVKQLAKSFGVGAAGGSLLGGVGHGVVTVAKKLFSPAEKSVLHEAGIAVDETAPGEVAGTNSVVNEPEPTEAPTEPTPTKSPKSTPAEAQVKEAGVPSPAESPASAPKVPLTPAQEQILSDFPNGLDKPAMSLLKKQGFADHPTVLNEIKQQITDAHAAANPDVPRQAIEDAVSKGKAPATEPIAKAETQKVTKETTGKLASEVPTGEHYLDEGKGKSVPVDTMHPKYAKNALNKMLRDHPETKDSSLAQALEARSKGTPTQPVSDIPGTSKTEGKLQSKRIAEARLKGNALQTTGQELRSDIHAHETNHRVQLQQVWDHIKPYTDLNKADQNLTREVVAGRATTDNPAVQLAAERVQQALKATRQQGLEAGLNIGDRGPNYLPEKLPDLKRKSNFNAAIKHLVDSGQAPDAEAAVKKLTQFQSDNSLTQNKFAHYQQRTADIPGEASHQALMDYFRKGTEANSLAKTFGPKGEVFDSHVANAARRGEDSGALKGIIGDYLHPRQAEGLGAGTTKTLQKVLRPLQLKSAAISHIPQQFVNTASSAGFRPWAKGVDKALMDGDMKQFLHEAGLNAEDFGRHGDAADKATAPGLAPFLAKWREFSGASGRIVAQGLAKNGDVAGLKQMLVSGPLKTAEDGSIQLTREQEMQAAHYQADKDIGSHSNIQNTSWAKTTAGRAWGNYLQAYVFKQSERIADMAREAKAGNVAPLVRYLAVGAPTGGAAITIGKEEYKQPGVNPLADPKKLLEGTVRNSGIGTIGYGVGDKLYDAATHNYGPDSRWQSAANLVGGSIAGTAVETGQNIAKASHGKTSPLIKEGIGLIPAPGTGYLANKFAPPSSTTAFQQGTNTGPPKTIQDLQAQNQKVNRDFVASLSSSDKKNFVDNKGNFINYNTIQDAHNKGIVSDDQFNHYLALEKTRNREMGNTKYQNQALDAAHASGKVDDQQYNLTKAFEQKQADLTTEGKNAVARRGPDPTQQAIADYINKQLPPGLSKLEANPDLAKTFASFTKATATNAAKAPEDQETPIDYQDRTIRFWAQVAKDGAPSNVQSVYRDGGNKAAMFLKQGKATKDDINQAVGLDNMLLASGIITTPKFSKKWRADNGYPAASDFMEGGAHYGTAGVGQYLSNGNNSVVATGKGGSGGGGGFGNGNTTALNDGSGIFSSVNKKSGAVTLKAVPSLNGTGTTSGVVDPDTGLFISKPTGIKDLLNTKDTTFKSPGINLPAFSKPQNPPKLKSFAAPDVRGTPRPQRAVPIRFQRAKFK